MDHAVKEKIIALFSQDLDQLCELDDDVYDNLIYRNTDEMQEILETYPLDEIENVLMEYLQTCSKKQACHFANFFFMYGVQDHYQAPSYPFLALLYVKMDPATCSDMYENLFYSLYSALTHESYWKCEPLENQEFLRALDAIK